jgi:hypothetical protein
MEDDPWGSTSVDPWMKQPEASESDGPPDPLQVPKEFTMARRSSTTADPWGVTHDDDNDLQTAHPEYAPAAGMPEPQAVPSLAWGAEVVDDGWGPSESKAAQTEQGFKTEVGLDEDTMPNYSNADVNVGFSAAEGREDNAATASSPLPSPVVSAEIDDETPPIPLEAVSDGLNEKRNGFEEFPSDNDGFAAGPFPSTTVLPTFQTSLPESPSFEDDTFGGFSGGFDEAAPMPEWGPTHKDDDDGWGSPTFDSPVLASQSRAPIDAWGNDETVDPDVTIADIPMDSRNTQEDEWDRARKAVQRREAVAVSHHATGELFTCSEFRLWHVTTAYRTSRKAGTGMETIGSRVLRGETSHCISPGRQGCWSGKRRYGGSRTVRLSIWLAL